jgi:hypothetical protein
MVRVEVFGAGLQFVTVIKFKFNFKYWIDFIITPSNPTNHFINSTINSAIITITMVEAALKT